MKLCFVIMPIGSGDAREVYLNRYTNIIKPAVEGYRTEGARVFDAIRADFITRSGSINKSVLEHIYNADLVIADLTDLNPNVFYELGVRHALRNGTILVALEGTKLPFDVGDLRAVFYKDRVGAEKEAVPAIQRLIGSLAEAGSPEDSPVFSALPVLQQPQTRDLLENQARAAALENEVAELRVKLALAEATSLNLRESTVRFENAIATAVEKLGATAADVAAEAHRAHVTEDQPTPSPVPVLPGLVVDPWAVFVLMPFREEFEGTYKVIRQAASRAGFNVRRADEMTSPGRIMDQILVAIQTAGLVLADITGSNPNVLYEVGIAHTLRKETVLISQSSHDIPFDIAMVRTLIYENSLTGATRLSHELKMLFAELRDRRMRDG
jgi:hypothetical protein